MMASSLPNQGPTNQWLMDRIQGQSKYGDRQRPPCPCCWVPPPVGWYPEILETSSCCRFWGGVGWFLSEGSRFWCLNVGFMLNLCSMILTAYACLAISTEYFVLTKAAFQEQTLVGVNGNFPDNVMLWIGLKAAALDNPVSGVGQVVVQFDQFCNLTGEGIDLYMDPSNCADCQDVSDNMIISLMIAVVSFFPTFFSQQLRMYSAYDVNCVKAYITILGVITLLLNLNVILSFTIICGPSFYTGIVLFDAQGNVLPPGSSESDVDFEVQYTSDWGWGLIILVTGTALKLFDVLINMCIPTPNVTRDRREQEIYESIGAEDMEAIRRIDKEMEPTQQVQDAHSSSSPSYPPPQQQQQQQQEYHEEQPSSSIEGSRSLPGDPSLSVQASSLPGAPSQAPYGEY